MSQERQRRAIVQAESPIALVFHVPREIRMYSVTNQELETLVSANTSVHLTFLGVAIGLFVAVLVTLLTVPLSDKMFAVFIALIAVGGGSIVYFGWRAYGDYTATRSRLDEIRGRK